MLFAKKDYASPLSARIVSVYGKDKGNIGSVVPATSECSELVNNYCVKNLIIRKTANHLCCERYGSLHSFKICGD